MMLTLHHAVLLTHAGALNRVQSEPASSTGFLHHPKLQGIRVGHRTCARQQFSVLPKPYAQPANLIQVQEKVRVQLGVKSGL